MVTNLLPDWIPLAVGWVLNRKSMLIFLASFLFTVSRLWAPPGEENLDTVLDRLGQEIRSYYEGLFSIACTEILVRQPLDSRLAAKGRPDEFAYDYVVLNKPAEAGGPLLAKAYREPTLINGKPLSSTRRSKIPDPASVYTEPLMFLLARERSGYDFSLGGYEHLNGRKVLVVTFSPKTYAPPEVKWEGNSFWLSKVRMKGRILVDPVTYEVVQLETNLVAPFEFRKPAIQRLGPLITFRSAPRMRLESFDSRIEYEAVQFQNPDQTLLLPVHAESLTVIRGASVSAFRTAQTFTKYKRFIITVKIKPPE